MSELSVRKPNVVVLTLCLFLCLTFFAVVLRKSVNRRDSLQGSQGNGYPIARHVQYSITLQNESNRLLETAELWVHAPVNQTATQRLENLRTSHPYALIADDRGNQAAYFVFHSLPPYDTKIVSVEADLTLSAMPNPLPAQNLDVFLKPERFIESDDPAIGRLAQTLRAATPLETAGNIFHWVAGNIRYAGYLPNDRGALYAFKNRQGDCSEFAYLFAACCRASGIPARVIGGYVCDADTILNPANYHNWAEFYVNGVWRVADPQRRVFMRDSSQYVAMQVLGDRPGNPLGETHRFHSSGDGIKVSMRP